MILLSVTDDYQSQTIALAQHGLHGSAKCRLASQTLYEPRRHRKAGADCEFVPQAFLAKIARHRSDSRFCRSRVDNVARTYAFRDRKVNTSHGESNVQHDFEPPLTTSEQRSGAARWRDRHPLVPWTYQCDLDSP
jgi:hypothetical protein